MEEEPNSKLVFAINCERFEVSDFDLSTTLLEFLRSHTRFKSVKLGCGQGGCGACVVLLSNYNPQLDQVESFTVSSCLTLLCSINGCSITTSDGLGNSKDGFHAIHERIAGFYATQCGFCTPGVCMSLFGALVNSEKTKSQELPSPGFSKLTVADAEKSFAGNLCRCTGYRSIADTCKSFSAEVDIEDLGFNAFWKKGDSKEKMISSLPTYDPNHQICLYPDFLKKEMKGNSIGNSKKRFWHSPRNMEDVQRLLRLNKVNGTQTKVVAGNTGMGYYQDIQEYESYVDLSDVWELSVIRRVQKGIQIGATVTISKAIEALRQECKSDITSKDNIILKKLANHMEKVASGFIRNTATVAGNLVMAQSKSFPSDIATILLAADAMVSIVTGARLERLTMEAFLQRSPLELESVLVNIEIPSWEQNENSSTESKSTLLYETYRAAPRPLGNALPYLNASFLAEISSCKSHGGILINTCRLAFGAYGTTHAVRARKVEEFLLGKTLNLSTLNEALNILRAAVVPEDGTSWSSYRSSLATGFLFDFLSPYLENHTGTINGFLNGSLSLLSTGKQEIQLNAEYQPVGEPVVKSGAALQASGEAVFVDDIPSPPSCLHGAFIYSTKPLARVKSINFEQNSRLDFLTAIISSKDIPKNGENIGSKTIFGIEPLFAEEVTNFAGDRLAFVVAETQKHANMAAESAVVDYDFDKLEPPILSVEEAVKRSSFFDVPSIVQPEEVGDISSGMAEADKKIVSAKIKLPSQYYFYMETQTALAIPDEDNCIVVYSSSQCPQYVHTTIARCLGIPEHNVRVLTRRVGGGFGGKAVKSMPVSAACALAAHKLRRPVRTYLNRKTDMIMAGGRHPMKITYSVGFKSNGKITALQLEILIDAGTAPDISPMMPHNVVGALKKYDWGALSFDVKVCKTNHSSKSAMRAPGEVQGSFIAEAIIEHVASELFMDVDCIRKINLHSYKSLSLFYKNSAGEDSEYTLPSIWDKLALSASFCTRMEMLKEFNKINHWKKRGISRVPVVHELTVRPTPGKVSILGDGSVIVEVGGIEIGQGLWTKVKQVAAYALASTLCNGMDDLLDKVRVVQADTLSVIQGGFTAGSTTSESSCEAVRLCCNILVEKLCPLKQKMGSIDWKTLISQAYTQNVNLSVSSYYVPDPTSTNYLNYGAAVSEVEVDLLTGEVTILQSDITYDCGQSLNPAVDLGQIEGAFVQGIGFFMYEEYSTNSDGLVVSEGTWSYEIPTIDTIPKQFNVEVLNSGRHEKRILSSKASGEPPLLLAASVHCATRSAIKEARKQLLSWGSADSCDTSFQLEVPAIMPVVKELCGLDMVERYLEWKMSIQRTCTVDRVDNRQSSNLLTKNCSINEK